MWSFLRVCPAVTNQTIPPSEGFAAVVTTVWSFPRVCQKMACYITCTLCRVLAPLTLVVVIPADAVMTTLHVFVQMILFQTRVVAVETVELHVFTCGAHG